MVSGASSVDPASVAHMNPNCGLKAPHPTELR